MGNYWLCQPAVTPIPAWDSEILAYRTPSSTNRKGCFLRGIGEFRYCPIDRAGRPPRLRVITERIYLKHLFRATNVDCVRYAGFIPAVNGEAFSSHFRNGCSMVSSQSAPYPRYGCTHLPRLNCSRIRLQRCSRQHSGQQTLRHSIRSNRPMRPNIRW